MILDVNMAPSAPVKDIQLSETAWEG